MTDHSTTYREQQLLILEAAATDEVTADRAPEIDTLLDVFGLPAAYKNILARVLMEGSWRSSESPIETVWRATMNAVPRCATMQAAIRRDEEGRSRREKGGHSAETLGWLNEMAQTSEAIRDNKRGFRGGKPGVWRQRGGREAAQHELIPQPIKHVPRELRTTSVADSREVPDWTKIAERAGLDEWETRALHMMARGETCYGAMQALEDAADKRAMEAAWRRLKRNLEKVRSILVCA